MPLALMLPSNLMNFKLIFAFRQVLLALNLAEFTKV